MEEKLSVKEMDAGDRKLRQFERRNMFSLYWQVD